MSENIDTKDFVIAYEKAAGDADKKYPFIKSIITRLLHGKVTDTRSGAVDSTSKSYPEARRSLQIDVARFIENGSCAGGIIEECKELNDLALIGVASEVHKRQQASDDAMMNGFAAVGLALPVGTIIFLASNFSAAAAVSGIMWTAGVARAACAVASDRRGARALENTINNLIPESGDDPQINQSPEAGTAAALTRGHGPS